MTQEEESIYTDGTYAQLHPEMHIQDSEWKANNVLKILSKNNISLKSICDVGCGAGEVIKVVHDNSPKDTRCYGYEISPEAFKLCETKKKERLSFFHKDVMNEKDAFFDLLICLDVFEHVDDYLGFIRGLKSKSKYKIFHIPLDLSVNTILRETPIILSRSNNGHLHYYTKYTAIETLKYCGYKIIDYNYTLASIERGSGTFLNNLGKIPRKALFKINEDFCATLLGGFSLMVLAE